MKLFLPIVFSILLMGCQPKSSWELSLIKTGNLETDSKKLIFKTTDMINQFDVEFLSIGNSLKMYLNVHAFPITPYDNDPKKAKVTISTDTNYLECIATRFEGGQKVLFSKEDTSKLIRIFKNNPIVLIELEDYRNKMDMRNFAQYFDKFDRDISHFTSNEWIGIAL